MSESNEYGTTTFEGTLWECEAYLRTFHEGIQIYFEAMRRADQADLDAIGVVEDMAERDVWRIDVTPTGRRSAGVARDAMLERVQHIRNERELYDIMGRSHISSTTSDEASAPTSDEAGEDGR